MSRLDELIQEKCPDGVEYKTLSEVFDTRNGYTPSKKEKNYWKNGTIPWFRMEDIRENGGILDKATQYVSQEAVKGSPFPANSIIVATSATIGEHALITVPSIANQRFTYLMVKEQYKDDYDPKFLYYYCFKLDEYCKECLNQGNFASVDMKKFAKFQFPRLPIEIQREIVRMLDSYTESVVELQRQLTAELTARQRQYEFYRDKLLTFDVLRGGTIDFNREILCRIADLGKWSGGKTPSMAEKKYWESGTIPWVSSKDVKQPILSDTIDHITNAAIDEASMTVYPAGSVAIVTRSGILRHTFPTYIPFETTVNQDIKILVTKEGISSRYVSHALQAYGENIRRTTKKQGGTVDSLDFQKVLAYKIPVPPIDVQNRIVNVLDNFERICSDLNIGLPAEIEARQKQYEYYRDKLLTFAENGNTILSRAEQSRAEQSRAEQSRALIKLLQYVFGYAMLPLSEIANVFRGEYITKKNEKAGNIPVILGGQEPAYYIDRANHIGEIVAVARSGASAGFVSYWDEPIFITDGFGYEVKKEVAIPKYLYYVLKNKEIELNGMKRGAGVPHVSGERLGEINLPVPPIEEQKRIISILDRFDAICNDLTSGLPAEIEARQRQYEYYRDKLLTFKERG